MLKTQEILVGSPGELLEHFSKFVEGKTYFKNENTADLLTSKEGLKKQITEIVDRSNGMGQLFYLDKLEFLTDKETPEVNLSLIGTYVHVKSIDEIKVESIVNSLKTDK